MFIPSPQIIQLFSVFLPALSRPAFKKACLLLCGVILTPGRRTVASALRALGLDQEKTFGKYHRFLSRDRWSALRLSQALLHLLLETFVGPDQVIDLIADETLERRAGKKIAFKGCFRDAVRSTHSVTVTTLGIRWLCLCLLVSVPWSARRWALPFLTVPLCSEKNCLQRHRPFRSSVTWTGEMMSKIRQWLGTTRAIRLIADGGFTSVALIRQCQLLQIEQIGRFRTDASLFDAPETQPAGKRGPKAKKGNRQLRLTERLVDPQTVWKTIPLAWYDGQQKTVQITSGKSLWYVPGNDPVWLRWVLVRPVPEEKNDPAIEKNDPARGKKAQKKTHQAVCFFSSEVTTSPEEIVACYAQRWNIEVFFEEVRACLGFETQRGWTNLTIGRTTPCLFGVFSLIVVLAKRLFPQTLPIRQAVWYKKDEATFRDTLCAVREHLWKHTLEGQQKMNTARSHNGHDHCLIPRQLWETLQQIACYAD